MKKQIKHSLLLLAAWMGISSLTAQEPQVANNFNLSNNESGSIKEYVARDEIRLSNNFTYAAHYGKTFTGRTDFSLVFPPTTNIYSRPNGTITTNPAQGGVVGTIPYQTGLNSTGAITCAIPIECPVGVNGLEPQIAIAYNSQSQEGLIGRGFDLTGISVISRVHKNLYHDNTTDPIAFQGNDRFTMDGMRLIAEDMSTYGNNGCIYFTESDETARITSYGTTGDGPTYFKVETPNGLIMEFGNNANSRLILPGETGIYQWFLNKITDNFGNTVLFNYTTDTSTNQKVISTITYAGNSINFFYETSPSRNDYYIKGKKLINNRRLTSIEVKTGTLLLKKYTLEYNLHSGESLLSNIKLTSGNNTTAYNPLSFSWDSYVSGTIQNNSYPSAQGNMIYIDYDNDGYDDIYIPGENKIYINKGNRFEAINYNGLDNIINFLGTSTRNRVTRSRGGTEYPNGFCTYHYALYVEPSASSIPINVYKKEYENKKEYDKDKEYQEKEFYLLYGDFLGTSKTQIFLMEYYGTHLVTHATGTNIRLNKTTINTNGINLYNKKGNIQVGDFDGDGKDEIAFMESGIIKVYKIQDNALTLAFTINAGYGAFYTVDVNNDGITDCIILKSQTGAANPVWNNTSYAMQEYTCHVYFRNNGSTTEIVSDAIKTDAFSEYIRLNHPAYTPADSDLKVHESIEIKDVKFTDLHSNGKMNMVILFNRSFYFSKYYPTMESTEFPEFSAYTKYVLRGFFNTQDLFEQNINTMFAGEYSMTASGNIAIGSFQGNRMSVEEQITNNQRELQDVHSRNKYQTLNIANLNGNGTKTVLAKGFIQSGAVTSALNSPRYMGNSDRYMVSIITDPLGSRINFKYQIPEKDFSVSQDYSFPLWTNYTPLDYKMGIPVIKSIEEKNDNLNHLKKWTYEFNNGVFSPLQGFIGYKETKVTDPNNILNTITKRVDGDGTNYLALLPSTEESVLKKITTESEVISKGNRRYSVHLKKITEEDKLTNTTITKTYRSFDDRGIPSDITTTYGNSFETTEDIRRTQKGAWYPNKTSVHRVTNTILSSNGNQSEVRETTYDYFDNGKVKKVVSNTHDPKRTTTEYQYYASGNLKEISVKAADITTPRKTTYTYTSSNRFLLSKTDYLNQQTSYDWNEERGWIRSETNHLGTTSYTYDGFGRVTEITHPDQTKTATVLRWADLNNSMKARYYIYTANSGGSPTYTWYDALGREVAKQQYGLESDGLISVFTQYDTAGRVKRISAPTFQNTAASWDAVYTYDSYGRVEQLETPAGYTYYTYNGLSIEIENPDGYQISTYNSAGQLINSDNNGKEVGYEYYPSGLLKQSTPEGSPSVVMEYDKQGNRTKILDPDGGVVTSSYNGFGNLLETKQKVHSSGDSVTTTYAYKPNGLLERMTINGKTNETTNYTYDANYRLTLAEIAGKHKQSFTYDAFNRITTVKEEYDSKTFERKTEYDVYGRVKKVIYPSGYYTINYYDNWGNLVETRDKSGKLISKIEHTNPRGQVTYLLKGNNKRTSLIYDEAGRNTSISTPNVMQYSYEFNYNSNLSAVYDNITNQSEIFYYDEHNRLNEWEHTNASYQSMNSRIQYDAKGNITKKTDVGSHTFKYNHATKPHALTGISDGGMLAYTTNDDRNLTYTDFKKVETITEGMDKHYSVTYGVDQQRRKSVYKKNNVTKRTVYYQGNYEEEVYANGNIRKLHYMNGAVYIQNNGRDSLLYMYTDNKGSLMALTNENGTVIEKYAYEPWGRRRDPANWNEVDGRSSFMINRGYTGHEHIIPFGEEGKAGIINMNGRIYDPLTAQFYSPDPYLQAPENWLNYNRYAYAYGNPNKFIDPTGEWIGYALAGAILLIKFIKEGIDNDWKKEKLNYGISVGSDTDGGNMGVSIGVGWDNSTLNMGYSNNQGIGFGYGKPGSSPAMFYPSTTYNAEKAVQKAEGNARNDYKYVSDLETLQHITQGSKFIFDTELRFDYGAQVYGEVKALGADVSLGIEKHSKPLGQINIGYDEGFSAEAYSIGSTSIGYGNISDPVRTSWAVSPGLGASMSYTGHNDFFKLGGLKTETINMGLFHVTNIYNPYNEKLLETHYTIDFGINFAAFLGIEASFKFGFKKQW